MKRDKLISRFVIGTFVSLYVLVSAISTIHSIDFFKLSNPDWMAITLAIAFEVGAAASLASLIIMDKMNKTLVWALFIAITAMQINGNLYYAFINMEDYQVWAELFNLLEWEELDKKRLLSVVSGAILPLIALGFIKSLVDYIKPEDEVKVIEEDVEEPGKFDDPEEEEDLFDWERFEERDSEEELMKDFEFDSEDWKELSEEDEFLSDEEADKLMEEFNLANEGWKESEEDFDEDHALDQVMNAMVEDFVEEDYQEDKKPSKDVERAFEFGKNLYQDTVKKMNSDHLQAPSKPSQEEITKAYNNLGVIRNK